MQTHVLRVGVHMSVEVGDGRALMMGGVQLPSREHQVRMAAVLAGQPLVSVVYFPLAAADTGVAVEEWDHGVWHEPTQGVQFTTAAGQVVSAVWCWDGERGIYELGLFPDPMWVHLIGIDEPGRSRAVEVSAHPRWLGFTRGDVRARMTSCPVDLGTPSGALGLRLDTADSSAWIGAGSGSNGPGAAVLELETDDVLVLFDL